MARATERRPWWRVRPTLDWRRCSSLSIQVKGLRDAAEFRDRPLRRVGRPPPWRTRISSEAGTVPVDSDPYEAEDVFLLLDDRLMLMRGRAEAIKPALVGVAVKAPEPLVGQSGGGG